MTDTLARYLYMHAQHKPNLYHALPFSVFINQYFKAIWSILKLKNIKQISGGDLGFAIDDARTLFAPMYLKCSAGRM